MIGRLDAVRDLVLGYCADGLLELLATPDIPPTVERDIRAALGFLTET